MHASPNKTDNNDVWALVAILKGNLNAQTELSFGTCWPLLIGILDLTVEVMGHC